MNLDGLFQGEKAQQSLADKDSLFYPAYGLANDSNYAPLHTVCKFPQHPLNYSSGHVSLLAMSIQHDFVPMSQMHGPFLL